GGRVARRPGCPRRPGPRREGDGAGDPGGGRHSSRGALRVSLPLERKRIGLTAGEMAYVDMGEGPPVLLLHGFPTSADLWRREAWLIAQRMRVIVPDLIGYGQSDKPVDADLTEPAQAGYVRELLDLLGVDDVAIVGHGIGGALAQMLALDAPGRVKALVLL